MSEYTVQVEVSNADGTIWLALEPSENVEVLGSAYDAAVLCADNQNITAEGDNWRVLVWDFANADTSTEPAEIYYPS
jgi:hypothetical protein